MYKLAPKQCPISTSPNMLQSVHWPTSPRTGSGTSLLDQLQHMHANIDSTGLWNTEDPHAQMCT